MSPGVGYPICHNVTTPHGTPLHKPVERAPNRSKFKDSCMGTLRSTKRYTLWVHQETERAQDPGQGQITMDKAGEGLIAAVGCLDYIHFYALMFLWATCDIGALFYPKVVTAGVHFLRKATHTHIRHVA